MALHHPLQGGIVQNCIGGCNPCPWAPTPLARYLRNLIEEVTEEGAAGDAEKSDHAAAADRAGTVSQIPAAKCSGPSRTEKRGGHNAR
jgi:hypothetical protein